MESIRQLIIPSRLEALVWFVVGTGIMVAANFSRLWQYASGASFRSILEQQSLFERISSWLLLQESRLDPRIVDFLVWMFIGTMVVAGVMMFQGWIQAAGKELTLLEYMRSPKGRSHEIHAVLLRVMLRIFGFVGLIVCLWMYLGFIGPTLDRIFFTAVLDIGDWQLWFWLIITPAITGLCIYVISIFGRLILLKTNNF